MESIILCESQKFFDFVFERFLRENSFCDKNRYTKEDLISSPEKFSDVRFIFSTWSMPKLTEDEIKKYLPKLECVFYAAGSVKYFAEPFLKLGIRVFSSWEANGIPVAEYSAAQIILAAKGFFKLQNVKSPEQYRSSKKYFRNYRGTYFTSVGLLGAGMIGKHVIRILKNYDVNILVFDPFMSEEKAEELGVRKVELPELFRRSNVVSNHLADNEHTKGIINYELLKTMPPFSSIINTGRGAQIVTDDLIRHLKERDDVFALLDVTDPEPLNIESELYKLDNCTITSHIAGSSGSEFHRLAQFQLEEYRRYIHGEAQKYEITLDMLPRLA